MPATTNNFWLLLLPAAAAILLLTAEIILLCRKKALFACLISILLILAACPALLFSISKGFPSLSGGFLPIASALASILIFVCVRIVQKKKAKSAMKSSLHAMEISDIGGES